MLFPDSSLASRPRTTSDHFPLLVSATTRVPVSRQFRFKNKWLLDPLFLPSTVPSWARPTPVPDGAKDIAARVKSFRHAAKVWKANHRFVPQYNNNCRFIIELFDFLEEHRVLSGDEVALHRDVRTALALSVRQQAAF